MANMAETKREPIGYLRCLLPNAVLLDPGTRFGCLEAVALGHEWSIVFDHSRQIMLLSHRHQVTEWTNMPRLNLHVRVMILLPESNQAFLGQLKIQNVAACRPTWT